ncbi:lysophospholipase [Paenibacillus sp. N1-5-1-14]|uniref:alpha/beta hydrolase n=1 Tax=Paenibacillus radicibacter TaxID=2972488 RepID=UPI002159B0D3|nr:lysophospholipase [Paenibacillus radicibacter]MCR8642447.1 lysophospholipase [Paenibacillus radicibacter]
MSTTSLSPYTIPQTLPGRIHTEIPTPQPRKRKVLRNILITLSLLIFSAVIAFHAYVALFLARPDIVPLPSNPMQKLGLSYEDVSFASSNGMTHLDGWLIPAVKSKKSIVFSHGYGENRAAPWVPTYTIAKEMHNRGYNVLMFDYSYATAGSTRLMTGGLQESKELAGAIEFLKERGMEQVYVWGYSMGAGTALQTALSQPNIDGMILDSTFILSSDTLSSNIKRLANLPKYPSVPLIQLFSSLIDGINMRDIPYKQVMAHSYNMPIYFIHGDKDQLAPYGVIEKLAANQKSPLSDKWIVQGGEHEMIHQSQSKAYFKNTFAFLDKVSSERTKFLASSTPL